jgi:DNA-directed RNA polymerase II subunit RPB2
MSLTKYVNEWDIIDTFFRDTDYYKSQHQIDSFDEFIFSEENGIRNIIKRENPFILFKGENKSTNTFAYEIRIFFGETLDKDGKPVSDVENIFVSSPAVYNQQGELNAMYPNEARLKNLTYKSNIFINIGIQYIFHDQDKIVIKNINKVNIGSVPIMIHSKICLLHKLDQIKLSDFGECPYDQGGYFIIKGKEKVILSQEKKVNNILYINQSAEDNIILQGNIKSISTEGFQSSRTNYVSYVIHKIKNNDIVRELKCFSVRVLGLEINIPLFILFRALGIQSDKEILSLIIYENDNNSLKHKLYELMIPSVKDSEPIYNQKAAYKFISLNTKGKENFNVTDLLNNNLFPNYGENNLSKAKYLGYVVRKILFTHLEIFSETDRDSYVNKRIDLPGSLLLELYRELWGKFKRNTSLKIDAEYKLNYESIEDSDISNIVNGLNVSKIFDNKIMETIVKSFGARFGTGISSRQGIVQDLNRNNMLGTLSHIRRLSTPLPSGSKTLGPRKLHNSQWGFVCPTESPDGGNVGIINHLAIIARVTSTIDESNIYHAIIDGEMHLIENISSRDLEESTKIFLNGKLIGVHYEPEVLYKYLKLLKLNSFINITTSISWNIQTKEIHVFCDSGRIIRPVFYLKENKDQEKYNELISGDYSKITTWRKAIHGYLYEINDNLNFNTNDYFKEELAKLKKNENYIEILEENAAVIEYIDSTETENCLISKDFKTFQNNHTHSEIHPSLILSALAVNIPFPDHSQYPRNVFSCQQTKHAVGVYSSSYNTRFETFAHILYYPQRPLVTTRYKKYTNVDKLPYGINAVVAIASYGGYNQEDAVIVNKSSVDRGMFTSLYLRSYDDEEDNSEGKKVYFGNPLNEKNVKKLKTEKYEKLDDNGFVKENIYVTHDDIIIGKCSKISKDGKDFTSFSGKTVNFGTSGIVDKVVVSSTDEGLRKCKVRIRKEKIPGVGDKFASRCGQKGMCGQVLPQWEMPFTKDGIVPDIIINPHAIPTRMTINQLLEVILGKTACFGGYLGDATSFQNNDINEFFNVLQSFGYEKNGDEVMYSGSTGDQIKTSIFIGPTYYQRLKIMVADKVHSRGTGPLQHLTRQPASGRSNNGGLRIGEMERDSIISHGISHFLKESMMERSDGFKVQIDKKSGLISYDDKKEDKVNINIPYTMKLLLQELQSMSIAARVVTDEAISNKPVFKYLFDNIKNFSTENDFIDDEDDFNEDDLNEESSN